MRGPHQIIRLIRTLATLERCRALDVILDAADAPKPLRLGAKILAWPIKWLGLKGDPALPPLTRAITALGPSYIKLGQILSTRPDVVGDDLALQLQYLQDRLPAFSTQLAQTIIEQELGAPLALHFSSFSDAIAAASIAQVHRAHLAQTGDAVAVKVLRPQIERAFQKDIDAFYLVASVMEKCAPAARRLKPLEVIRHFENVVKGELDLRLESAAAAEFGANIAKDHGFRVPMPLWHLSSRRVMTMDWVDGLSLTDHEALRRAGHDLPALAARLLQLFLQHALRDGYFHADLHQGNLKVNAAGDIVAYDFGIMGRIDAYTRRAYAEILFGFLRKDYRRVAEVHFEAGYVPAHQNIDEFASALRVVGEPIFNKDANQISMARLLAYLFEVTERFGMETRTELILLQRTMVVVEGVARNLDPNINIWQSAAPVVEAYIAQNIGPRAFLRDFSQSLRILTHFSPKIPGFLEQNLIKMLHQSPPQSSKFHPLIWLSLGAGLMALGVIIGSHI